MLVDVFGQDAFQMEELTDAINLLDHLPTRLGDMSLFTPQGVPTTSIAIEELNGILSLVQTSERGGPGQRLAKGKRNLRTIQIPHISLEDTIKAEEIQGVRAFGSDANLQAVQATVAARQAELRRSLELTQENLRLGAIKGVITDADASTLLNLATVFNVTPPSTQFLDLASNTNLRGSIAAILRLVDAALKGAGGLQFGYRAVCGATFWDNFVNHSDVKETFLNWQAAQDLRGDGRRPLHFGGVDWEEYRGTDDGSTVSIDTDSFHLFPVGVPGLFREYYAPADYMETVNTRGLPFYSKVAADGRFNKAADLEVQTNYLAICTQPGVLVTGSRNAS